MASTIWFMVGPHESQVTRFHEPGHAHGIVADSEPLHPAWPGSLPLGAYGPPVLAAQAFRHGSGLTDPLDAAGFTVHDGRG
jgi:hypothetical protein